jgi:hypothetical protein
MAGNTNLRTHPNFEGCTQMQMADLRQCPIQKFEPDIFKLPKDCKVHITFEKLSLVAKKQVVAHIFANGKAGGPQFVASDFPKNAAGFQAILNPRNGS